MFDGFLKFFGEEIQVTGTGKAYADFINELGGRSFGEGQFRTFSGENVTKWMDILQQAYPEFPVPARPFAYDWLGRCFGIDLTKGNAGNVLVYDIGEGEIVRTPVPFETFLNETLPQEPEACLGESFFREWQQTAAAPLGYNECVGYKVPLFLGGEDELSNMEVSDMEVYWVVMLQVKLQTRNAPKKKSFLDRLRGK